MTLPESVRGSKLEALEAIRDRLAEELAGERLCPSCKGPTISNTAAVAKQLVDVLERIEAIKPTEESAVDDISAELDGAGVSDISGGRRKQGVGGRKVGRKRGAAS